MSLAGQVCPRQLGAYELLELIAQGGMAEVYLARRNGPRGFHKYFAVKRILPQLAQDPSFVGMFVDEARLSAHLSHPNIASVFDFGEQDGELFMAMEYVHGTTCARLLRAARASTRSERLGLDIALGITKSMLRALEFAHSVVDEYGQPACIVHRDVSPGNVLLSADGTVKLTDFGIARAAMIERRTDAGQLKGKLGYMSPEQVLGGPLDHRSDLFTTAVVLAELVMRRPLFVGASEIDVLTQIADADLRVLHEVPESLMPEDLRAVLTRALAANPARRFADARVFIDALEAVEERHGVESNAERLASLLRAMDLVPPPLNERGYPPPMPSGAYASVSLANARSESSEWPALSVAPMSEPRWRLRGRDGSSTQLSFSLLVELLVTGALPVGALLSRGAGEFLPPHRHIELSRFVEQALPASWLKYGGMRRVLDRLRLPSMLMHYARYR